MPFLFQLEMAKTYPIRLDYEFDGRVEGVNYAEKIYAAAMLCLHHVGKHL